MAGTSRREFLAGSLLFFGVARHGGLGQLVDSGTQERDPEFLALHQDMRNLEEKLYSNLPAVPKTREQFETLDGQKIPVTGQPPEGVDEIIEDTFRERTTKLASRYGMHRISNQAYIFTSGEYVMVEDGGLGDGILIFGQNSLILQRSSFREGERPTVGHRWPHLKMVSIPNTDGSYTIRRLPEVWNGLIPYFKTGDFAEIQEKVKQFESDYRKSRAFGYDPNHGKPGLLCGHLQDIGYMLIESIQDSADPTIRGNLQRMSLALASTFIEGDRVVVEGWSYHAISENRLDIRYVPRVTLSIGSEGDVKYSSKDVDAWNNHEFVKNGREINANLRIQFPIPPSR